MERQVARGCSQPEWVWYVRQAGHIDGEAWVMSRFVQVDRDTAYLLPPSVQNKYPITACRLGGNQEQLADAANRKGKRGKGKGERQTVKK